MLRILTITTLLLMAPLAQAGDDNETLFNKVSLQAEAQREVPNDEMSVLLVAEHQGSEPSVLAERVNADMDWALKQARQADAIKTETRGYSTQPIYDDGVVRGWRVRQQLQLKSEDFAGLTELLGELQERLQVAQMGFSPTPETQQKHQDELITEAMERFKERVAIIRKSMEDRDYRIIDLNVNTSGFGQQPFAAMADMSMARAERSAPAVEGGTSQVTVTVSGSVQFY
ncbi:putative secreted protein [Methylohalomonas lacus]|uniref:Secreted protein n=1 Tax=Methylohalomonas lacus TaxID=398773 RepID=A0AAE3HLJ8_9GAMM|nr:SIMPL domain-containing protein [Methylohalomonas lacus]MCS3903453.1 putative secreted protein [Methylohalomonas lacus]